MIGEKRKLALLMMLGASLAGCGESDIVSARTETVYDCSVLSKEEKSTLTEMYERCDIKNQYGNSCKEHARQALCKPTIYLIPESYKGSNIKPALSKKAVTDISEENSLYLSRNLASSRNQEQ